MRTTLFAATLGALFFCAVGCKTTRSDTEQQKLQRELGAKVPLWVELECSRKGQPRFKEYSVLKLPTEAVGWALARLDDHCRVYGTLVEKVATADLCDIRYRSKEPVTTGPRCKCIPGRYDLEEGYPSSKRCCEKYPEKVYCKQPVAPPPTAPEDAPRDD
jgi:hypothetical protein